MDSLNEKEQKLFCSKYCGLTETTDYFHRSTTTSTWKKHFLTKNHINNWETYGSFFNTFLSKMSTLQKPLEQLNFMDLYPDKETPLSYNSNYWQTDDNDGYNYRTVPPRESIVQLFFEFLSKD